MRDGLQQLEGKRRNRGRNILPPRNPVAGPEAGPSLSVVLDESDEDTTSSEPVEVEQAAAAQFPEDRHNAAGAMDVLHVHV